MNIDTIILKESPRVEFFYPFSILHPSWELRCGAFRIFERVQKAFPNAELLFTGREDQTQLFRDKFGFSDNKLGKSDLLILTAEVIVDTEFLNELETKYEQFIKESGSKKATLLTKNKFPFALYLPKEEQLNTTEIDKNFLIESMERFYDVYNKIEIESAKLLNYLWDAIYLNGEVISDDFKYFKPEMNPDEFKKSGTHFINENDVRIGDGTKIAPGVVIDASNGPVIIGQNVNIFPQATLIGPCFIGNNSQVKIGAKIYEDTSIGEVCKVGGEIENTIIQSYSNKQHEGFLGHSFLSEWVNIGADTNNSDLKNTYGEIKIRIEDMEFNTGKMFLGLLCGDHTKTAINTAFTTGTVAGICGIIVHDGFLPNFIPSYAWTGRKNCPIYKIDKAIEIAEKVMARRDIVLSDKEKDILKLEYERVKEKYYK